MFKTLDRYIIKKFVLTFLSILLGLSIIVGIVDFTNKNETFINHNLNLVDVVRYYCSFLPFIINFLIPIIIFISAVFLTFRLAQKSEIIAILGAGVSYKRLLRPYMICASLIAIGSFILTGWILPNINKIRIDYEDRLGFTFLISKPKYIHIKISPTEYLFIERYRSTANIGINATIEKVVDSKMIEKFYATTIAWQCEKKLWRFSNWTKREIEDWGEKISRGDEEERKLDLMPSDLDINPRLYEQLTLPSLHKHTHDLRERQSETLKYFLVEIYIRYMAPFAAIILTLLGVFISSHKMRKGAGVQLTIGVALAFIYVYMFLFSRSFAESSGENMFLKIWTPNIIFAIVCYFIYKRVPK